MRNICNRSLTAHQPIEWQRCKNSRSVVECTAFRRFSFGRTRLQTKHRRSPFATQNISLFQLNQILTDRFENRWLQLLILRMGADFAAIFGIATEFQRRFPALFAIRRSGDSRK